MGNILGVLGGLGMLALVAALFCAFLRECGVWKRAMARLLGRAAATVGGIAAAYWLAGGLIYSVISGPVAGLTEINAIFRTPALEKMYEALRQPSFYAPVSGLFSYLGHAVGAALFGQYLLGGVVTALGMTIAGAALLLIRLESIVGEKAAADGLFLLLSLPGALFLFLPGWPPLAFLLGAALFYVLGKRLPAFAPSYSQAAYAGAVSLCAILSAAVLFAVVTGKLV